MKAVALALAVAWPLAAPGALDSGRDWGRVENRAAGHELRFPPGWHAYARHGVTIVSSRRLPRPAASPAAIELRRGDAYLWIDQYRSKVYAGEEGPRPAEFTSLPRAGSYDCGFGNGHQLLFRDGGFHVHAFVRLGPRTSQREALAILNSLRVTK